MDCGAAWDVCAKITVIVVETVGGGPVTSDKTTPPIMTVYLAYGITHTNVAFPSESDVAEKFWPVHIKVLEVPSIQQQKVVFSQTVTF
jgi:hypothetical protein